METLSCEIISNIGRFLPWQDRKTCLETAKNFSLVTASIRNHQLVFGEDDIVTKFVRLPQTLRYIKKIKPILNRFVFVINYCTEFLYVPTTEWKQSISTILAEQKTKQVVLELNYCTDDAIVYLASAFDQCNNMIIHVQKLRVRGDESWLSEKHLHGVFTSYSDTLLIDKLRHFPEISIYLDDFEIHQENLVVDFTKIDTNYNKKLDVHIAYSEKSVQFVNIGKATLLSIKHESTITRELVDCLKKDLSLLRVEEVIVQCFTNIEQDLWIDFIRVLPKTVIYRLCVSNPNSLWYIYELECNGSKNIQYNCNSRQTWLAANLCKMCFHPYEIVMSQNFQHNEHMMNGLVTASDFLNAMELHWRVKWMPVFIMFTKKTI